MVPTDSTREDVCYGDRVVLVESSTGKVINHLDTATWSSGYLCLRPKTVPGEVHVVFTKASRNGMPVVVDGSKFALQVVSAKDNSLPLTTLTVSKKVGSPDFLLLLPDFSTLPILPFNVLVYIS